MNRIHRIRRLAGIVTGVAVTCLGLTAEPAAFAAQVAPGGGAGPVSPGSAVVTRMVLVGGTPGWQIALIAAAAALLAAGLAVLADRARAARRAIVPAAA
jgi:hypothetical protein